MTAVVDASVAARWCFRIDRSDRAEALLRSEPRLIAPDLVLVELTNVAWKFVQFDKQPDDLVAATIRQAERAFDELVPARLLHVRALEIAIALRHAAYDCFYLALAEKRECPFVTADDKLLHRCENTAFAELVRPL